MNKLKIFVIILNFSSGQAILDCLKSLQKVKSDNRLEMLVVDNKSSDGSLTLIKKDFPEVKVIENEKNLGFAEGNNVGIRYALKKGADYVMLLNNDTVIEKNCLRELLKVVGKDKEIGIVSPKIYFAPGFEFHRKRYQKEERGKVIWFAGGEIDWQNILGIHRGVDEVDQGQYEEQREIEFATGCCLLVKKEVFGKIGLLDPKYFLYLEDLDFSVRVKKAGFKIVFSPKAIIWHKNLGTTSKESAERQAYYYTRNRLLFGLKYASLKTKIGLLKWSLVKLLKGSFWAKRGVRDFYLRRLGKGSYKIN